ncbi:hypothetical protein [Corynebacterium sp. TAE3-ERU16]|uniref:hypothetical protein n=1 Tax=Corynebacterium sp. TAE3-ERU16 TaxID=2849493 RepID=UPI001C448E40|nr:hypothetical protein [Corynebacterium sp. TAE3-ERU16]MBV7292330.1 hypothetical protein [Corynebacterium sp. TAE3-ERU16]
MHSPAYTTDMKSREVLEKLILQQAVIKELVRINKEWKADLAEVMRDGESLPVTNERGLKLGTFSKSLPKPKARVVKESVLLEVAGEEDTEWYLPEINLQAAVDVVMEHAPELMSLRLTEAARTRMETDAINRWKKTGEQTPGFEVSVGEGSLSGRPNTDAAEAAENILAGITSLPALEAGEGEDQ